jgi:hypothetical protein
MIRIDQAMQQIRNLHPKVFTLADLEDELQSMAMITCLPSEYDSFRSSLMLLDQIDKKTLQEAFRNEEINRLRSQNEDSSSSSTKALAASSSPSQSVICDFCGRPYHTIVRELRKLKRSHLLLLNLLEMQVFVLLIPLVLHPDLSMLTGMPTQVQPL